MTASGGANSGVGTLYVVATPIGNLEDISARALRVLREVALIAAEDTRHSRGCWRTSVSRRRWPLVMSITSATKGRFIERLQAGDDVALISDAGTPLISDPGYHLVRQAGRQEWLSSRAGACALIAALSAAGLPSDRFIFEGFLPAKRLRVHVSRR